jgi:hypothetical protein
VTMNTLERQLDQTAPGWRTTVNDPQFQDWATRIGPRMFGPTYRPRQEVLDDAARSGDVATVIQLLRDFEEYRSRSPTRTPIATFTREQIAENYRQHRRGAWNGREDEWARLERSMIAAARDGRVPNGQPLAKNWQDGF